ncbi:TetR/AcrR family transcriptional regulator [Motilimonas sp. 1_MG-2023]|uniref:TetR/AcrR family transcriptional regulator n=1 Tax=Motilimonas sp. 1_MG-2023 TaxID=3062672 RepID=UPI0026E33637|nr:TetR/AcrR family transcriptional regulator [Motilimonas sp. 1_MG-2023]MDO6527606.1 TetR/AcrR family transcriptional regulator [Motilimonas sp. 1_MG-2023]
MAVSRKNMTEKTRTELIMQARALFASKGFSGTPLEELTAAVGLTRGALYHHFGNKKGLFYAVVQLIDNEMDAKLIAVESRANSPKEALIRRVETYLEMASEQEVQRIMLRDAYSILEPEQLTLAAAQCIKSVTELLAKIHPTKSLVKHQAMAHFINGGLTNLALWIANHNNPAEAVLAAKETAKQLLENITAE